MYMCAHTHTLTHTHTHTLSLSLSHTHTLSLSHTHKKGGSTRGAATTPSGIGKLRYRLGGCVGEGATGKVYVGLNVSTGELLAVKR